MSAPGRLKGPDLSRWIEGTAVRLSPCKVAFLCATLCESLCAAPIYWQSVNPLTQRIVSCSQSAACVPVRCTGILDEAQPSSLRCTAVLRKPRGLPFTWWGCCVYVFDINQPSLSTPFYSVLVSISVFMALWTVFHSINSPDNSPLSHSVLPILFLPYWSFQTHVSLWKSPSALKSSLWLTGLKAPTN